MKKLIPVLIVLTLVITLFAGCKKSEAAKQCEDMIKQIGEVTLDSAAAIEAAEKAYALLSGEDKGDVKNFDTLSEARAAYNGIKAFSDSAAELSDLLDRVFKDTSVNAAAVTTAYETLSTSLGEAPAKQKAQYEEIFSSAKEKYDEYVKECEGVIPSAAVYVKSFLEMPKEEGTIISIDKVGCVAQLDGDTLYFLFAISYTENGETKNVYSNARYAGTPSKESMQKYQDSFYKTEPLSDNLNALENGNVILDTAKVLEAAAG